jgi:hypothetical protein
MLHELFRGRGAYNGLESQLHWQWERGEDADHGANSTGDGAAGDRKKVGNRPHDRVHGHCVQRGGVGVHE